MVIIVGNITDIIRNPTAACFPALCLSHGIKWLKYGNLWSQFFRCYYSTKSHDWYTECYCGTFFRCYYSTDLYRWCTESYRLTFSRVVFKTRNHTANIKNATAAGFSGVTSLRNHMAIIRNTTTACSLALCLSHRIIRLLYGNLRPQFFRCSYSTESCGWCMETSGRNFSDAIILRNHTADVRKPTAAIFSLILYYRITRLIYGIIRLRGFLYFIGLTESHG